MRKYFLFALLLCLATVNAIGQNKTLYTVQVGTFLDAKLIDFDAIKSFGHIYANELGGNTYSVYVGRYEKKADADKVLRQVKNKGYSNAFLQERYTADGEDVVVIQLATKAAGKAINWEEYLKAGDLYALLLGNQIKITTGIFPSIEAAKKELGAYRAKYNGAFVKKINSAYLHRVSQFETGVKKELIPIAFDQPTSRKRNTQPRPGEQRKEVPISYEESSIDYDIPTSYDDLTVKSPKSKTISRKEYASSSAPKIRGKVKRGSVLELQKVLKAEKTYSSSLDGYYGKGTKAAYKKAVEANREYQKYVLLAEYMDPSGSGVAADNLQRAINDLPFDKSAQEFITRSEQAIALAYRAYLSFTNYGPSGEVNDLMNSAIRTSYSGKRLKSQPPFDYRATYAYKDLEQLILHLHYVHGAPGNKYSAPCWLFQVHPNETALAYESLATFAGSSIRLQACDEFLSWEELRVAQTIAADLNGESSPNAAALAQAASLRSKLYLAPRVLNTSEKRSVENWNRNLWSGLNSWGARDPLHQKILTAFKISFFQSQVLLEDHYMNKGFKADKAKELALATLQTLVGYHLERFI